MTRLSDSAKRKIQCIPAHTCVQFTTKKVVTDALIIDSKNSDNPKSFMSDNELLYYVSINTWLGLLEEISSKKQPEVVLQLSKIGLIETIREAVMVSDTLLNGSDLPLTCFVYFLRDVSSSNEIEALRLTLFGLRFLKRLSPLGLDKLKDLGVAALISANNHCKMWSRRNDSYAVTSLRGVVHSLFVAHPSIRWNVLKNLVLPTGADYDKNVITPAHKLLKVERAIPLLLGNLVGLNDQPLIGRHYTTRVTAVPKSYKAVRVIAIEEVVAQIEQQIFNSNLFRNLSSRCYAIANMDVTDQERNRSFARDGSIDGSVATIDLTSASDTVSHSLIMSVLPSELAALYDKVRSRYFAIGSKRYTSSIAGTMGSRLTFPIETMIFYCIAILSVEWYSATCRITASEKKVLLSKCSAFGDDIIVPTECSELCLQLLATFGFLPNKEKSFYDPQFLYRESCGEEYYHGVNISSKYFPRRPMPSEVVPLVTYLVDLQHKLVDYRYVNAFLIECIRNYHPQMTESYVNSPYSDIWSYFPNETKVYLKDWRFVKGKLTSNGSIESEFASRIVHYCSVTRYQAKASIEEMDAYHRYAYYIFLERGPYYSDSLMELLHCSEPRITKNAFLGVPQQVSATVQQ